MGLRAILAGVLGALVLSVPAQAQGAWPAECKLVQAATLPFHLAGGHLTIDVKVNGAPRQFIIDTGGFASSINDKAADALHLRRNGIRGNVRLIDAGGNEAKYFTTVGSLEIGNLNAKDIQLMVMEGGIDGLIAPDLLRNFDLEIDFPNRVINFFRPHPCEGKAVYWTDKSSSVAIDITGQGHIRVPITLNGRTLYAMMDTGAPISLLAADIAASRFDLKPEGPELKLSGANGGALTVTPSSFDSLQIGDTVLQKPVIGLSRSKADSFTDGSSLILGLRELQKFHIYIAYRERRLYIAEEENKPSAAVTVSAKTMEPAEAIAAALRAAPAPFAATFTFVVKSTGMSNGQVFLNSEANFRDPANLSVTLPPAEAAKLGAAPTDLVGKRITVIGAAHRVRLVILKDGKPSDEFYDQTRIPIPSASQVTVTP